MRPTAQRCRASCAHRDRPLPQRLLPVPARGQVDLGEDEVDHPVEQGLLAGDVVVQRHRLDPERLPELAHAERLEARLVGECDGASHHLLPADPLARHVDKLTA